MEAADMSHSLVLEGTTDAEGIKTAVETEA